MKELDKTTFRRVVRRRIYLVQDTCENPPTHWTTIREVDTLREAKTALGEIVAYNNARFNGRWHRIVQYTGYILGSEVPSKTMRRKPNK